MESIKQCNYLIIILDIIITFVFDGKIGLNNSKYDLIVKQTKILSKSWFLPIVGHIKTHTLNPHSKQELVSCHPMRFSFDAGLHFSPRKSVGEGKCTNIYIDF